MSVMSALGSPFGDVSLVDESRWSAMLVLPFAVHRPSNGPAAWVWVLLAGCPGPADWPLLYPADMHNPPGAAGRRHGSPESRQECPALPPGPGEPGLAWASGQMNRRTAPAASRYQSVTF